jgi:hypothetical protein
MTRPGGGLRAAGWQALLCHALTHQLQQAAAAAEGGSAQAQQQQVSSRDVAQLAGLLSQLARLKQPGMPTGAGGRQPAAAAAAAAPDSRRPPRRAAAAHLPLVKAAANALLQVAAARQLLLGPQQLHQLLGLLASLGGRPPALPWLQQQLASVGRQLTYCRCEAAARQLPGSCLCLQFVAASRG